jgi:membrane fusion protein (multidrug efflux system)
MPQSSIHASLPSILRIGALAMLGTAILAGCKPKADQHGGMGGMPPPPVSVVAVQTQNLPVNYSYTGQAAGSREAEVRARVSGILLKRNYTEGAPVKAGQSLFTVDPAQFEAARARADAEVASAQARQSQAQRNMARIKPLVEAKAIAQKEWDDAVSAAQIAAADLKSAQARLTEARLNLGYTRVESPISGIASRARQSEGSLVSGPDVLLTTVTQVDPMYVHFGIPDREHLQLQKDVQAGRLTLPKDNAFEVEVALADGSAYEKAGKLNFSDVRIDPATGTSEARATVPNPGAVLRAGQFVRVTLKGAMRSNVIVVPQRAVMEGPQGKFVYVVTPDSKADARPVQAGDWTGDGWVINQGLKPGDKVIVDGVMKIGPGAPVSVVDPNAPKQPGAPAAGGDPAKGAVPDKGAPNKGAGDQPPAKQ